MTIGRPREMEEGDDERLPGEIGIHAAHEADVDLHELWPELDEVIEVRDAGTGIVDREAETRAERHEGRPERRVVLDRVVLGDLEDDRPRSGRQDRAQLVPGQDQCRRNVQAEEAFHRQSLGRGDGRAQGD
jgi:hypothetical protein